MMSTRKSFLTYLAQAVEQYRTDQQQEIPQVPTSCPNRLQRLLSWLLPNGGTLLIVLALVMTQSLWAKPLQAPLRAPGPSATTVNYQGRLADNAGGPLDGTYGMSFALYDAATGGNLVWGPEAHMAVPVSGGLFSTGLGSQTAGGIPTTAWDGDRYLEITVGGETLSPRELIRSVPIAGMALTVPDGAIKSEQIADGAVTQAKAPFAPLTYWYGVDGTPDPNMKMTVSTHVVNPAGANWIQIDISAYGFTGTPAGMCEIVDTAVTVRNYFCAYSWDGSSKDVVSIQFYNYNGASSGPSESSRIVLWLMGK